MVSGKFIVKRETNCRRYTGWLCNTHGVRVRRNDKLKRELKNPSSPKLVIPSARAFEIRISRTRDFLAFPGI